MSIVELIRRLFADKEIAKLMELVDAPLRRDNPKYFDQVDNANDINTMVTKHNNIILIIKSLLNLN